MPSRDLEIAVSIAAERVRASMYAFGTVRVPEQRRAIAHQIAQELLRPAKDVLDATPTSIKEAFAKAPLPPPPQCPGGSGSGLASDALDVTELLSGLPDAVDLFRTVVASSGWPNLQALRDKVTDLRRRHNDMCATIGVRLTRTEACELRERAEFYTALSNCAPPLRSLGAQVELAAIEVRSVAPRSTMLTDLQGMICEQEELARRIRTSCNMLERSFSTARAALLERASTMRQRLRGLDGLDETGDGAGARIAERFDGVVSAANSVLQYAGRCPDDAETKAACDEARDLSRRLPADRQHAIARAESAQRVMLSLVMAGRVAFSASATQIVCNAETDDGLVRTTVHTIADGSCVSLAIPYAASDLEYNAGAMAIITDYTSAILALKERNGKLEDGTVTTIKHILDDAQRVGVFKNNLVVSSSSGYVQLFDTAGTLCDKGAFKAHKGPIDGLAVGANFFATLGAGESNDETEIRVWPTNKSVARRSLTRTPKPACKWKLLGANAMAAHMQHLYVSNGRDVHQLRVAAAAPEKQFLSQHHIWSAPEGELISSLGVSDGLLAVSSGGCVTVIDTEARQTRYSIRIPDRNIGWAVPAPNWVTLYKVEDSELQVHRAPQTGGE